MIILSASRERCWIVKSNLGKKSDYKPFAQLSGCFNFHRDEWFNCLHKASDKGIYWITHSNSSLLSRFSVSRTSWLTGGIWVIFWIWLVQTVGWFHVRIHLIQDQIYLSWQTISVNKCYLKTSTDLSAKEVNFKKQEFSFGFSDLSRFCSEGHKSSCLITAVPQKFVVAAVDRNQFFILVGCFWRLLAIKLSVLERVLSPPRDGIRTAFG